MRRRLLLAIVGVACASLLLLAVPLAVVVEHDYRDQELSRLERDALAATRAVDVSATSDPIELPSSPDELAVYSPAGTRVAGRGPARADGLVAAALRSGRAAAAQRGGRLVAAVPLVSGERITGAVRDARSGAHLSARVETARAELGALAVAVLALALAAAAFLSRRLAVPLERLAGSARRLGEGDFSARAPHSGIPELDALSHALDSTAERLDALLARERAFTADASHQLRTPLAALRLELESMALHEGEREELSAALAQVERLQGTIETLLSVARDTPRRQHDTDLARVVDEVAELWTGRLAATARPLRVRALAADARSAASGPVVREVLEVLLGNAHQHGSGAVQLTVREAGSFLAIDVADEGPGVGAAGQSVFQRRSARARGLGIGLALARSLAQAEGGELTVSSGPRPVFTLTLPRRRAPNPARDAEGAPA